MEKKSRKIERLAEQEELQLLRDQVRNLKGECASLHVALEDARDAQRRANHCLLREQRAKGQNESLASALLAVAVQAYPVNELALAVSVGAVATGVDEEMALQCLRRLLPLVTDALLEAEIYRLRRRDPGGPSLGGGLNDTLDDLDDLDEDDD